MLDKVTVAIEESSNHLFPGLISAALLCLTNTQTLAASHTRMRTHKIIPSSLPAIAHTDLTSYYALIDIVILLLQRLG